MSPRSCAGRERDRRDRRRRLVHREVRLLRLRRPRLRRPAVIPRAAAPRARGRLACETIATGDGWRADGDGPVVDIRDLRGRAPGPRAARTRGWSASGYDDAALGARASSAPPPGRATRTCRCPRRASRRPCAGSRRCRSPRCSPRRRGGLILDFGQNLVGRLRLRVTARPARALTVRHAEVLDEGELALRPLRNAGVHRRVRPRRRRRGDLWSRASRSTGSGTRRSTAGRASSTPPPSRPSCCTPT